MFGGKPNRLAVTRAAFFTKFTYFYVFDNMSNMTYYCCMKIQETQKKVIDTCKKRTKEYDNE